MRISRPSANATCVANTLSRVAPYLTVRLPAALLATCRQSTHWHPDQGQKQAVTRQNRIQILVANAGLNSHLEVVGVQCDDAIHALKRGEMPPNNGMGLPSSDDPAPQGVTGTSAALAMRSTSATCRAVLGHTTSSAIWGAWCDISCERRRRSGFGRRQILNSDNRFQLLQNLFRHWSELRHTNLSTF